MKGPDNGIRKDIGIKPVYHGYERGPACELLAHKPANKCLPGTFYTIVDNVTVQLNSDCDTYGDIAAKCGFLITLNRRFDIECGHNSSQIPNRSRDQSVPMNWYRFRRYFKQIFLKRTMRACPVETHADFDNGDFDNDDVIFVNDLVCFANTQVGSVHSHGSCHFKHSYIIVYLVVLAHPTDGDRSMSKLAHIRKL